VIVHPLLTADFARNLERQLSGYGPERFSGGPKSGCFSFLISLLRALARVGRFGASWVDNLDRYICVVWCDSAEFLSGLNSGPLISHHSLTGRFAPEQPFRSFANDP